MKDSGSGGHRSSGSTSLESILATLIPTFAIAVIFLAIFVAIRATYRKIYSPRTFIGTIPEKDRTPSSSRTGSRWFRDFRGLHDKFVLQHHQTIDSFLFLRFLKLIVAICFIGSCITWPILFPVNATGGGDSTQLDRISFSNIANKSHLWAHVAVAWVFFGIILYVVARERLFLIGARQAYLSSPRFSKRLSSRVVLFLAVPDEAVHTESLQKVFGAEAEELWVASDISDVEKLVAERNSRVMLLESAETKLCSNATKRRTQDSDGHELNGDDPSAVTDKKSRPTHRLTPIIGKKVDTIQWTRDTLPDLTSKAKESQEKMKTKEGREGNSVFVAFSSPVAAQRAFSEIKFHPLLPISARYIGVQPKEVLWNNLALSPRNRVSRAGTATVFVVVITLLWAIPIGIIGAISNVSYLADNVKWLSWIKNLPPSIVGVLSGLLPPAITSSVVSYMPKFFRYVAKLSGEPTIPQAELKAQAWYFVFQVVQIFLVTTFSSGAAAVATKIAQDPKLAPTLLAENLPKAANFYLSYFLLQGLSSAAKNVLNYSDLFEYLFYDKFIDTTPRHKYNRFTRMKSISWCSVYPKFSNMAVIAIAYSCISPLVMGFACVGIYLYYLSYRYNLFYVIEPKIDTKGESYARALQNLLTGVYIAELCLIGLFGLKEAPGPTTLAAILLFTTIISHVLFDRLVLPLELYPPVNEDEEDTPLLTTTEDSEAEPHHPGQRLGIPKLPTPVSSPIASFLQSHISHARSTIKSSLHDHSARLEDSPPDLSSEEKTKAYMNPALTSKPPKLWLPKDQAGVSKKEIQENEAVGIEATDEGAWLDDKGRVKWDEADFTTVPVFKEPVRY